MNDAPEPALTHQQKTQASALSKDGTHLAIVDLDGTVEIFRVE